MNRPLEHVVALLRARFTKPFTSIEDVRSRFEALAQELPAVDAAEERIVEHDNLSGRWVDLGETEGRRTVYFLHGGGYNCGSTAIYRDFMARLARSAMAHVFGLDYRLAPEHPFPAALEDAVAGYEYLLSDGVRPANLVVVGDSAGGGLAVALLVALRDRGHPLPAGAVCLSPWTDLAGTGASLRERAFQDPWLNPDLAQKSRRLYLGDRDPRQPLASPVYADLHGLPPLLVLVGTREILYEDAVALHERAKDAGVDVRLDVWDEMIHVWPFFAGILPEGLAAIEEIGAFIDARTGA